MIQDASVPVSSVIASATKAKPCALTVVATPPAVGDIIVPRGTGWNSIEGMPFKVITVAGMVVTLEDSDTSREVAAINTVAVPVGKIEKPLFLELCRSTFAANQPAGATIDVTTLCDDAHRIVPGLPAIATWTAAGFYDCADLALARARDLYRSGAKTAFDVILADGCGFTYMGLINTFDVALGINAAVTNALGGQVDGMIHFYKTPPVGWVAPAEAEMAPSAVGPQRREREPERVSA
jgi:hypothetical protein